MSAAVAGPPGLTKPPSPREPVLVVRDLGKRYGATVALDGAALELCAGEVHALVGANGSGKSTLTKIVTGLVRPDRGTFTCGGAPVSVRTPAEAARLGIVAVYQELSLVPDLSVGTNVWLGHELPGRFGRVDAGAMRARTAELLALFRGVTGPRFRPETPVCQLSPEEQQLVEILKALSKNPRVLILDEATASLDARQVACVFGLVRRWKAEGMSIVLVTHRMHEIFEVADRATVLRNGQVVGKLALGDASPEALVTLMVGEAARAAASAAHPKVSAAPTGSRVPALEVAVTRGDRLRGLHFTIAQGEVVGLGGLQGQGQSQLLRLLFGLDGFEGRISRQGQPVAFRQPRDAMNVGVVLVPGNRNTEGLAGIRPILENVLLSSWERYRWGPLLDQRGARRDAVALTRDLHLKAESLDVPVSSLSGGNAQKVVLAKWLLRSPRVLLLDDPTKGIDVMAKAEFYRLLAELRDRGLGVLFYSSDDDELANLCDRVLVMFEGVIVRELAGAELSQAALVRASLNAEIPA